MHRLHPALIIAALVLAGCSGAQQPDPARYRMYQPPSVGNISPRVNAPVLPEVPARAAFSQDVGGNGLLEQTGSVAVPREHRPWPRVGTPEWQAEQAAEAEMERRVRAAIESICRGC